MASVTGYRVEDMTTIGEADNGESIHFTLKLVGGETVSLIVPHTLVPKFQIGIQGAASMAAKERLKRFGTHKAADEAYGTTPIPIVHFQPGLVWDEAGKKFDVLLQLRGPDQVSMSLSLESQTAIALGEGLQEAGKAAPLQKLPKPN